MSTYQPKRIGKLTPEELCRRLEYLKRRIIETPHAVVLDSAMLNPPKPPQFAADYPEIQFLYIPSFAAVHPQFKEIAGPGYHWRFETAEDLETFQNWLMR